MKKLQEQVGDKNQAPSISLDTLKQMNNENFGKRIKKEPYLRFLAIYRLAEFMHDEYQKAAKMVGWKTQESCPVDFADLPTRNQQTMLLVAEKIYRAYLESERRATKKRR